MAQGDKGLKLWLYKATFAKTSNGFWLAWDNDTIEKIAVLPPDHPREFPCEWLCDTKSIEEAVRIVESGQYVKSEYVRSDISENIPQIEDCKVKKTQRRILVEPRLTHRQQVDLMTGKSIEWVLNDKQKRHLQWRKKVLGELSLETNAPSFYLYALHEDGCLTYQFKLKTLSPLWYAHTYLHPTRAHFHKHNKSQSKEMIFGCVLCKVKPNQKEGLLADIHLLADGLSELTIIHEAVHAAAYLSRVIDNQEAKTLAAPYVRWSHNDNNLMCREEIQCRTVEFLSKQIVMHLRALGVLCVPIHDADIMN
ncbi:hypothetical protein [Methylobacter sp.]|uniref:hypothetical protein n=1 Tax=Methylobacter sp. TaxID=2051955 RepID=UPI0024874781|nr:hypothetical protein [Methylobacter sp.]MDI1277279.1 hypothetical protein [Methylobacter sp.]MDI1357845.1 hypothetical protein [Methylobacter sp.]